jgi:putative endonuclease
MWYVYVLTCADGTLYTGVTTELERRLAEHNAGAKGAKYTKTRRPVRLAYSETAADRSSALKREFAIKHLTREEKQRLIN